MHHENVPPHTQTPYEPIALADTLWHPAMFCNSKSASIAALGLDDGVYPFVLEFMIHVHGSWILKTTDESCTSGGH